MTENLREIVSTWSQRFGLLLLVCAMVGCGESGPPLAPVTGTITLKGEPLTGALVEFQPITSEGSPSYAETDEAGSYDLMFTQDKRGAWVGEHRVRITTRNENERVAEKLPPEYNEQSTLQMTVEAGKANTFDFVIE